VAIAIAGPVGGEVIRFTNNPWIIRPALIPEKLGVSAYTLVNDFAAVAHAVARAPEDQFLHLAGPDRPLPDVGTLSVLGPGTGLGVAWLWRDGQGFAPCPGDRRRPCRFRPARPDRGRDPARLRKAHLRVSVERVVSGPAIVEIYNTLAAMEGRAVPQLDDISIWTAAMDGSDSLAAAAMDRFCLSLGAVAAIPRWPRARAAS
jgi:glucokinase